MQASVNQANAPRKLKFTVAALAGIKSPAEGRTTVYDEKVAGLAYTLTSKGSVGFYLVGRIHGRPTRLKLGGAAMTIDQARDAARRMQGSIADGVNPAEDRRNRRRVGTLGELWQTYLDEHLTLRATPKTIISDKSRYETCLKPWAARKALDITPADIRTLHSALGSERGKVTANRAIQLLRRIFNSARIGYNPIHRGEVAMFHEQSRTRFLSPNELGRFLDALTDISINSAIADIIRLSLFTGCRRANAQAARVEEFDLDAGVWTIPAGKSKSAETMMLPLVPQAVELVRHRLGHPSGFLFPSYSAVGHVVEVKSTMTKVLTLAKLEDVRFHDVRRTFGSWQAAGGTSLVIIGKSLGHKNLAATQIYARLDLTAVRQSATAAVGAMLATTAKVDAEIAQT